MPGNLILCPTFDHSDSLFMSIASVRAQTVEAWRMVVICDGVPPRTIEVLEAICGDDPRITYVSHSKGERYGEAYRDAVIREASEDFIFHLSDDDIWSAVHLERMRALLEEADWGYQSELGVQLAGGSAWTPHNLGTEAMRRAWGRHRFTTGGLNNVAYRRRAYLSLKEGWVPAPAHLPSDCFMWAKF
ncbi:MAG: glycosyltransferase family A protein, partial [Pseudomonadota bacterium]